MSQHNWNELKVEELRNELKKRGLKTGGTKSELVARLMSAETPSEATSKHNSAESKSFSPRSPRGRRSSTSGSDNRQTTTARHSRKSSTGTSESGQVSHSKIEKSQNEGDTKASPRVKLGSTSTTAAASTSHSVSSSAVSYPTVALTSSFLARRSRHYVALALVVVFLFVVLLLFPPVHNMFSPDTLYALFIFTVLVLFTVLDRLQDGQQ